MEQRTNATIAKSDVLTVTSKNTGDEYLIQVGLPISYDQNPDTSYPIVYLIDSNLIFELAVGTVRNMILSRECPEVILVGIGYPMDTFDFIHFLIRRAKDLTSIVDERYEQFLRTALQNPELDISTGHAESFLAFITEELMPTIEARYRVNSEDKTLFGHSTGGHFAVYTFLNQTQAFHRYIVGSPSLGTGEDALFDMESTYAEQHDDLPVRLFLGIGEDEEHSHLSPAGYLGTIVSVSAFYRFVALLRERGYPGLQMKHTLFKGFDHASVMGAVLAIGLKSVFSE